ncbi:MAG TPA: hypothetical protein VGO21_04645 [Candidatus Paceibacterota bacterium]|jgi:hypothetical protein|nr:hypothetical protein [Candidatus Paceibacterota bacterium]
MQIKFLRKKVSFKEKGPAINYHLYWSFVFYISLFLALIAFAFGFYLFKKINKEPVTLVKENSGQIQTVKKERIDDVLLYFSKKKEKSNQILNSPAPVLDPSL